MRGTRGSAVVAAGTLCLLVAGCSGGETEASPSREGVVGLPLEESLPVFVSSPNATHAALLADDMGATGEERWVPYLVDLLRMAWSSDSVTAAEQALARITGVPPADDEVATYVTYGSWLLDNEPAPGREYAGWKRSLYELVDPDIASLLSGVDDLQLLARLQWGGVPRGGIPELNDPAILPAAEATFMTEDEVVFGVTVGGAARAYPLRVLGHHELANDVLGGRPIAFAYCSLCRAGIAFDRRVGGRTVAFETSGLLLESNKVMVDRDTETLWRHLTGEAVAGPLAGEALTMLPVETTTWAEWRREHPDTDVLDLPPQEIVSNEGFGTRTYSYEPGAAYSNYYGSQDIWFPVLSTPDVLPLKERVATLDHAGAALAVAVDELEEPLVLAVADGHVLVVPTDAGARFYDAGDPAQVPSDAEGRVDAGVVVDAGDAWAVLADGRHLQRLAGGHSFWFAWYGLHPDTAWWPSG
jgi:hypothetical protein